MTKKYAAGAVEVRVASRTATATNVSQRFIKVAHHRKLDALTRILEVENFEAMIVFVRTKQATEELAERLRARGFSAAAINGDVVQNQRERTINQLREGKLDVLVATDVAARGLDVERISHVVNHDIPTDNESYVHRIGRTGRAGRSGHAISFVTPRENHLLRSIEKTTRQPMTEMAVPSVGDVNETRVQRFTEAITQALGDSQVDLFRELIGAYQRDHEVEAIDIAAAIAVLAQDGQPLLLEEDAPEETRPERGSREPRGDRKPSRSQGGDKARDRGPRRRNAQPMAPYRLAVGRRQRVEPRQIVGALANEGGLSREDFGRIDISIAHSIVELPADLPAETLEKLRDTRISGVLIDIRPDTGAPPRRGGPRERRNDDNQTRSTRPDRQKKPRHKSKKDR
jgi:ATP-dependent RNA helicase DeaD